MRETVKRSVQENKLIAIVRGQTPEDCIKITEALYKGGINMIEVTFNQKKPESFKDTAKAIQEICHRFKGNVLAGAGTVLTKDQVQLAADYGAQYIISPDANKDTITFTRSLGLVSMPGAMTPSEIITAYNWGADFVKLFPASDLGPGYLKAILAPISHVPIMAVGGIDETNLADYLKVGCVGAGLGGSLVHKTWIAQGEFDKITQAAQRLVKIVKDE